MAFFSSVDSITMGFVVFPAANVFFMLIVPPKPISLHRSIFEISNVILIGQLHHPLAMRLVVGKISDIDRVIGKFHIAFSHLMPKAEFPLVGGSLCD